MAETNAQIRTLTEELIAELRQHRIDSGLPPEAPANFVSIPLSIVIAERLAPFKRIAIKYAAVLAGGTLLRMDTAKLASYRKDAELLSMSVGLWCGTIGCGVLDVLRVMDTDFNDEDTNVSDVLRRVHLDIEFISSNPRDDAWDEVSRSIEVSVEVERLKADPIAFQTEFDAAAAHYETIKHLI